MFFQIYSFINKIRNINIIISNSNIYSLSCLTIIKNTKKDNLIFYYINNNGSLSFMNKYLYILLGYFINIDMTYIDYIPDNIDNFIYLSKLFRSNIKFQLIDNFNLFSNKYYLKFENQYIFNFNESLINEQKFFFEKIRKSSLEYINNTNDNIDNIDNLSLINGINLYFNKNNFNDNTLWDTSFYGEVAINLFIKDGKRKNNL